MYNIQKTTEGIHYDNSKNKVRYDAIQKGFCRN